MAWYHVNDCECPIGCCDCGDEKPSYPYFGPTDFIPVKQYTKGKCTGCGLRSKNAICWRCATTLEEEEFINVG